MCNTTSRNEPVILRLHCLCLFVFRCLVDQTNEQANPNTMQHTQPTQAHEHIKTMNKQTQSRTKSKNKEKQNKPNLRRQHARSTHSTAIS